MFKSGVELAWCVDERAVRSLPGFFFLATRSYRRVCMAELGLKQPNLVSQQRVT